MALSSVFKRFTKQQPETPARRDLRNYPITTIIDDALMGVRMEDRSRTRNKLLAAPNLPFLAMLIKVEIGKINFNSDLFLRWASAHGELETMIYLHQNGADLSVMNGACAHSAARNGHVPILEYLDSHGQVRPHARYCANIAAMKGRTEVLSFMLEIVPEEVINPATLDAAAKGGRIDVMIWLRDHGANLTAAAEFSAACAIQYGQIETLDWMLAQNLPVNLHSCAPHSQINATFAGHLKSLQWLEDHNQPLKHNQIICIAANYGHEDIVQWCHERGTRVTNLRETHRLMKQAEKRGHDAIATVMREQINSHGTATVAAALSDEAPAATGTNRFRHLLGKLGR